MVLSKHSDSEVTSLLAYRMIYEYTTKKIAEEICTETLDYFMKDLGNCYEELKITRDNMKAVWKAALEILAYDGTILPTELPASIQLSTIDYLLNLLFRAVEAIK